jgi:S1-C subfamily serine protease
VIGDLWRRGLLFPVGVAGAALVLLAQGVYSRRAAAPAPTPPPHDPPPTAEHRPSSRSGLEKTPLEYQSDFWLQLGEQARHGLVAVGPDAIPVVVVAPGIGVTSLPAADTLEQDAASSFRVVGRDLEARLAVLHLDAATGGTPLSPSTFAGVHPGALVATVGLGADRRLQITPAHVVAVSLLDEMPASTAGPPPPRSTTIALSVVPHALTVGAVVDLDGRLVGIAVETRDGGTRVVSAPATDAVVEAAGRSEPCRPIQVASLDRGVARLVGAPGLLVEQVDSESFAGKPPLRPGDVLVDWDGEAPLSARKFEELYAARAPGSTVSVTLLRGRERLRTAVRLPASDCRPPSVDPVALESLGLTLRFETASAGRRGGWRVGDVVPGSRAVRAGLAQGDRVLEVDRVALAGSEDRPRIVALSRRAKPTLLTVRRGERVLLLALPPARPDAASPR